LGTLLRAGRRIVVSAPQDSTGVIGEVTRPSWVEYGASLVSFGDPTTSLSARADEGDAGDLVAPEGVTVIRSDTDGTVYLTPEPGQPPFAPVNHPVDAQQTLALVEVMKTFSPVRAPLAGVLLRVCVAGGEAVEAGAPLFWVGPASSKG